MVLLDEAYIDSCHHATDRHRRLFDTCRCRCRPHLLEGLRASRHATGYSICSPGMGRTLWSMQLPFGATVTSLAAVAASFDAEANCVTESADHGRTRLPALTAVGHGHLEC